MIDTDKYEGHDMHRITIDKSGANHSYVIYTNKHGGKDSMYVNDTTAELIVDAPLLLAEVKRLRKLEATVVGSWMESCDRGSPWHKQLRYPCVELGYLELRDVEHISRIGNRFTSTEFHLKEEYEEMAKQWIKEEYGDEEE
tara:strand:- start:473 stop:895 length:423 start_codon:yes stop_codon:yes gene_type:complete